MLYTSTHLPHIKQKGERLMFVSTAAPRNPRIIQVWTVWVHSYMDFFQYIEKFLEIFNNLKKFVDKPYNLEILKKEKVLL